MIRLETCILWSRLHHCSRGRFCPAIILRLRNEGLACSIYILKAILSAISLLFLCSISLSGAVSMTMYAEELKLALEGIGNERSTNRNIKLECSNYFKFIKLGVPVSKYDPALLEIGAKRGLIHINNRNQIYYTINNPELYKLQSKFHSGDYIVLSFITEKLSIDSLIVSYECSLLNAEDF